MGRRCDRRKPQRSEYIQLICKKRATTDGFSLSELAVYNLSTTRNEDVLVNQIRLYPNPTLAAFNIDIPASFIVEGVTMTDMKGAGDVKRSHSGLVVNVGQRAPGIYLLQIKSKDLVVVKNAVLE
ncbi:T9SS type A sorting domain-containing protein [Pseudochryseolinea flava]|uniref:Secretion system C-terminal sorting domain-containing protein n=1 Tax=Pseudochryseolinea flava TaxID=2059302 RepID=A0A364Y7C3_9BACT|nr:T9SS type A sorting domain-containing protein [Pseudochryseolinea flava]RAW02297.1 hypothetical protein DQQ10_07120 [Pseudochryseolinea flava]